MLLFFKYFMHFLLLVQNPGSRRRHYHTADSKSVVPLMPVTGTVNCGYMVPTSHPANIQNSTSNGGTLNKCSKRHQHLHITNQVRALQLEDECRRPCSNSSSTSDCSSGSHSPPETPSLPLISEVPPDHHFDRGELHALSQRLILIASLLIVVDEYLNPMQTC